MCKTECKLCDRLVISNAVSIVSGQVVINLPAGSYQNGEKYCIVVAQAIPAAATINEPVAISIGTGGVAYPLLTKCGVQVVASGIRTRTRYATKVVTNATTGAFRLLGDLNCTATSQLTAINGTA